MKSVVWGMPIDDTAVEVFRRLGRREARAGRSHDVLQSAYRVSSQAVMAQLLNWEREHDAPREVMASVSTAVFEFIDELARFSAEGYIDAQSARADDTRVRAELVTVLVHRDGFSRRQVVDAAARIGWAVPERVTVVEIVCDGDVAVVASVLGSDALVGRVGDHVLAVVPDSIDLAILRESVAKSMDDVLFVVGSTVKLVEAASSARLAQRLRARHDVRTRAVGGVVACDDHLVEVMIDSGRDAARALAASRLAPLSVLSAAKRLKYGRLLSAWLEYGTLAADEPGVLDKHRQTLRYQVTQLDKMFGESLRDRTARLELMIALRAALPLWERQATARNGAANS